MPNRQLVILLDIFFFALYMMRTLCINGIGPINKETKISFKRFCILIGPQSSGKSTIAKLLSTCMWLEKEACTSLSNDVLPKDSDFRSLVEEYHRMHGYFTEHSILNYESDYVKISYKNSKFSLKVKNDSLYHRIKISYIPSDRNVITMDRLDQSSLSSTNFRSFLFDWFSCRKYFNKTNKADILNLGVKYFYDNKKVDRGDLIVPNLGNSSAIPLYDASSGAQSAVPLVITTKYYTETYFNLYDKEISFENKNQLLDLWQKLINKYFSSKDNKSSIELYTEAKTYKNADINLKTKADKVDAEFYKLSVPCSTCFIIEEPELNLFPKTQKEMIFDLVRNCNGKYKCSALITTHSPYVLSVINILIFAGKVARLLSAESELKKLFSIVPEQGIISLDEIEVYSVNNGTCTSIIDKETGLISMNDLDSVSEDNAALFDKLYSFFVSTVNK